MPRWRILKRLKASPTNLMGPDFDDAPWYEIDLSGIKVKLKRPFTDVLAPYEPIPTKFNIFDSCTYDSKEEDSIKCATIFETGWGFWQSYLKSNSQMGGTFVHINIEERKDKQESLNQSFFNSSYYKKWLLSDIKTLWDRKNKRVYENRPEHFVEPVNPAYDYWQYPTSEDQILPVEYNGHIWYEYDIYKIGRANERQCHLPISENHQISISFNPTCYQYDYFDPATNIREATEQSRITFMQNLHIELSNDAKAQKQAVLDALKTTEPAE